MVEWVLICLWPWSAFLRLTAWVKAQLVSHKAAQAAGGEGNKRQKSGKGKDRDKDYEGNADKGDKDDKDPDNDPEDLSGDWAGAIATWPPEFSFEIISQIYPIQDEQSTFQTLTMHGSLTIEVFPCFYQIA